MDIVTAEELLKALQSGGHLLREAIQQLYMESYRPIIAQGRRMGLHPSDAEDIANQTFIKILDRAGSQYRGDSPPVAYALRIARNLTIDRFRRIDSKHSALVDDEGELLPEVADLAVNPFQEPEAKAMTQEIRDCVANCAKKVRELPDDYQLVIALIFQEGLKPSEIAGRLGRTEAATRQLVYEVRKRLRTILAECQQLTSDNHD